MKLNSHQEEIVEDIATVMYDAYIQSKGGKDASGQNFPIWDVLKKDYAKSEYNAWLDSARATYKYILE
jgi:hypothetical protein